MTSKTSRAPKLRMLNIPHGFCTAPVASFHSPKLPASAQAGSTNSPIARPCGNWGKTIRNITAGRKAKAGTMANGAPIMNARSRSFRVIESLNHRDIESFKTSGHQRRISMIQWLNTVHGLAANHRTQNFRRHDFRRESGGNVLIENDKVGEHARLQLAFLLFRKLGKRRARRVGGDRLLAVQFLRGIVSLPPDFAHTGKRSVEPAKRRHRFDGIIRAKGQHHPAAKELSPRVGMLGALRSQTRLGPVHVGEQMVRLHGGDYFEFLETQNLRRRETLRWRDAQPLIIPAI